MSVEKGKKELVYFKEVDTGRLMEELYEAIPELKPIVHEDGSFDVNLRIFTNGSKLMLWIPEDLDEYKVNEVVKVHEVVIFMEEGEADGVSSDFE